MAQFRWPLLVALICLPVAVLATGIPLPYLDSPAGGAQPLRVAAGEIEVAWLNTTTSWTAWERFVAGVARARLTVPGLRVDDRKAYRDQSFEVPELSLTVDGRPGRVRIRWYKLSSEATVNQWVEALAARDPAPIAVIGGWTSDRAAELARALDRQRVWFGDRPLFLVTTATTDDLIELSGEPDPSGGKPNPTLLDLYDGRTFRFCFSNRQMAEAVLDFVWDRPELRPQLFAEMAPLAVVSGSAAAEQTPRANPRAFALTWLDDPFSRDLYRQFADLSDEKRRAAHSGNADDPPVRLFVRNVPFSVGGFTRPNAYEAEAVAAVLDEFRALPPQRTLLVLPTVTAPARRVLRAIAAAVPDLGQRMVAVTGDGVSVNSVYRDGEFAWPVLALPVPLVLFAHQNPFGWDDMNVPEDRSKEYELTPPTSTDDVFLYAEMTRVLAETSFGMRTTEADCPPVEGGTIAGANELASRLRTRCPPFFDGEGNRLGGTGEYVVVVRPRPSAEPDPLTRLEVWRRGEARHWEHVRTLDIDQWRTRIADRIDRGAGE